MILSIMKIRCAVLELLHVNTDVRIDREADKGIEWF